MDNLVKLSDYDIFGYFVSGLVALAVFDVLTGLKLVLGVGTWTIGHGVFIIIAAYVLGHIVAATATLLFDRILVRKVLGIPSEILISEPDLKSLWWRPWILSGYLEPLPASVRQRVLSRAGVTQAQASGEEIFWRAWPIIKREPLPYARMDAFLRLYGFCRNFSFVALLASLACLVRSPALPGGVSAAYLGWGLLFVFLAMFHRHLKFFRLYSAEVFSTYAEPQAGRGGA